MIDVTVRIEGSEAIREKLRLIAHPDLRPLLERIEKIVQVGTDRDRAEGAGRLGPMDEIKDSTARRRARAGRGLGPPLHADERSRFSRVHTEIFQPTENSGLIVGDWPGTEAFIGHHISGTPRMVARDPTFVSDRTMEEIRAEIRAFYADILARGTA